jgi:uncharacterized membrane protein (UPF0127 family)
MRYFLNKKKIFIGIGIVFLCGGIFFYARKMLNHKDKNITLGKCGFVVEKAIDEESRERGLSSRSNLCSECGMLFIFQKSDKYGFWMKDMQFNLDILWINDDKIIEIEENIPHNTKETFYPRELVDNVLEINAGDVKRCDIKIGQKLQ